MSVSVIIPAFRPTFLTQAIASVLSQGFEDYELIISDDSRGEEVRAVVERFSDPRIHYSRTGGLGSRDNVVRGWELAQRDLVKYLFDDDLLMPNALIDLVDACHAHPGALLSFGHRQIIDEQGRITDEPKFVAEGRTLEIDGKLLCRLIAKDVRNPIGEFSNVLFNRANGVEPRDFLFYEGFELMMLGDVGVYLNAAHRGSVVGIGRVVGGFRRHANQNSSPSFNPIFAKSICEWELFLRGEFARGAVMADEALAGLGRLERGYRRWVGDMPALAGLTSGLAGFRAKITAGDLEVFDEPFRAAWARTDDLIMRPHGQAD